MTTKSYSEKITQTKLLLDGLKELRESLPAGMKSNVLENLENLRTKIEALNTEQETLKALLKSKTEELNLELSKLNKIISDTKKRIKLDIDKSLWKKFGIQDKR